MLYVLIGIIVSLGAVLFILNRSNSESKESSKEIETENDEFILKYEEKNINYKVYVLSIDERLKYMLVGYVGLFLISYIFYASVFFSMIISIIGMILPRYQKEHLRKARQDKLTLEFKDALYSIYTSLAAGESPENALKQVPEDLASLYSGEDTFIIPEFEIIRRRLEMNISIEQVLGSFAGRTGVQDIENFADIFITSIDTGGRQNEIIKNSINTIVEKIEIKRDITIKISGKKFEAQVMTLMPVFMILFLSIMSGDYIEPMYTTFEGRIVMTVALAIIGIAYKVGEKIMTIEV